MENDDHSYSSSFPKEDDDLPVNRAVDVTASPSTSNRIKENKNSRLLLQLLVLSLVKYIFLQMEQLGESFLQILVVQEKLYAKSKV